MPTSSSAAEVGLVPPRTRGAITGLIRSTPSSAAPDSVELLHARLALDDVVGVASGAQARGVEVLRGRAVVNARLQELATRTRTEAISLHAGGPPTEEVLATARTADLDLLARGVEVRVVNPQHYLVHQPEMQEYADLLGENGAQVRFAEAVPHRLVVLDGTHAVLPADQHDPGAGALLVREPLLVRSLRFLALRIFRRGLTAEQWRASTTTYEPSPVERRVLVLMSTGVTDEVAAKRLGITDRQFRRYVARLLDALDAGSRFQAGVRAVERGWL
jgi:hypothetical protein